jgi:sucrose-6-phosphate hydrolase SacC (GH32 family)
MEEKNNALEKQIKSLKKIVAQFYEELDDLSEDFEEKLSNLYIINGSLEETVNELETKLKVLNQTNTTEAKLKRIPVDSSMVNAVGYDLSEETLYVEFSNTGYIYAYYEVEVEIFKELLEASSIGSYIRNNVIDCYGYDKMNRKNFKW